MMRRKPLPIAEARGRLIVTQSAGEVTLRALAGFRGADGRHEGLVFWAGRQIDSRTYVLSAIVPECTHARQSVMADQQQVGDAARRAWALGLGIVAQVHSHPGSWTEHSDGDDELILMPFEGMFSLVVAKYGDGGLRASESASLHQFQDGRWIGIDPEAAEQVLVIVPEVILP